MSQPPNGISIASAVFAPITREPNSHTDTQTLRPRYARHMKQQSASMDFWQAMRT